MGNNTSEALKLKYYTMKSLTEKIGVSVPTLYRLIKAGEVPQPITIGNRKLWPKDIYDEIESTKIEKYKQSLRQNGFDV